MEIFGAGMKIILRIIAQCIRDKREFCSFGCFMLKFTVKVISRAVILTDSMS